MKRHVQETGVRLWAGDDLIELQSEPLRVVEDFFSQFGNMIISGCEVAGDTLSKGLVALNGFDPNGNPVYKVAPVEETSGLTFPVYLALKCSVEKREYGDGNMKPVKEVYTAELSNTVPNTDYLTINDSGNIRFADTISPGSRKITLNNVLSNAEYWETKADIPVQSTNSYTQTVAIGNLIYVRYGLNDFLCYDSSTDSWTIKASAPIARLLSKLAIVNGLIYEIGGSSGLNRLNSVECYNPQTDTWTSKANMPKVLSNLACASVVNNIFVIGGTDGMASDKVYCYDTATDIWTTKANMSTTKYDLTASVVDGKIYTFGGSPSASSTVECYNPQTDSWTTKANMPTSRVGSTSIVVDNKICVLGNMNDSLSRLNECYNPQTDTWESREQIPTGGYYLSASVVDGNIYVFGGYKRALKNECYTHAELKELKIMGNSRISLNKNALWNNKLKVANIPFETSGPGTLTLLETGVSGEIRESLDVTM